MNLRDKLGQVFINKISKKFIPVMEDKIVDAIITGLDELDKKTDSTKTPLDDLAEVELQKLLMGASLKLFKRLNERQNLGQKRGRKR